MSRLRRADPTRPGIARRRAGRGFVYVDAEGHRVTDAGTLDRIRALVLPPAWTDVWICTDPRGHIQATGVDAAGRRQYRYHDAWRTGRDREKFDHMLEFARALPALRRRITRDLATEGLTRDRVLACAARLLDLGFFRIGTEGYAEQNQTYGLATMRKEHVALTGDRLRFDYAAKSGKRRIQSVVDPAVAEVIRALKRRRAGGRELLAYRRADGSWADVKSADINAYVKEATGGEFTAKDFRTWNATVLCAVALGVSEECATAAARRRAVTRAYAEVAHYLGNTPAVCKASYVDPRVIDLFGSGATVRRTVERTSDPCAIERAVLALLDGEEAGALPRAG